VSFSWHDPGMGYPRRLLTADESVVLDLHPHWRRVALPVAAVPVLVGLGSFLVAAVPSGRYQLPERGAVAAVALALLLVGCLRPWLRWQCTHYVVTTRRVVIREGVLGRRGRDIPLTRISDVSFTHSLLERLFRAGTLVVDSAGEQGELTLRDVPRVEQVQRTVFDLADVLARDQGSGQVRGSTGDSGTGWGQTRIS